MAGYVRPHRRFCKQGNIIHLMSDPEGNSQFCFPERETSRLEEAVNV